MRLTTGEPGFCQPSARGWLSGPADIRGEQSTPSRLDDPVNYPSRMGLAKGSDRRKRVENIAHGSQTDHEQPKPGLRLQTPIFSQGGLAGCHAQLGKSAISKLHPRLRSRCARPAVFRGKSARKGRCQRFQPDPILFRGHERNSARGPRLAGQTLHIFSRVARGGRGRTCAAQGALHRPQARQRTAPGVRCRRRPPPGHSGRESPSCGAAARWGRTSAGLPDFGRSAQIHAQTAPPPADRPGWPARSPVPSPSRARAGCRRAEG